MLETNAPESVVEFGNATVLEDGQAEIDFQVDLGAELEAMHMMTKNQWL